MFNELAWDRFEELCVSIVGYERSGFKSFLEDVPGVVVGVSTARLCVDVACALPDETGTVFVTMSDLLVGVDDVGPDRMS